MVKRRQFLTTTLAASHSTFADSGQDAIANLAQGKVRGAKKDGVIIFKGIPYGEDTRQCRFQPAVAPANWKGVRAATEFGDFAPQNGIKEQTSENCLVLNIWTPALRDQRQRPVIVYIHGGGYTNGSGSEAVVDGSHLALRGDAVVITMNHRINLFGYLYLAKLGGEKFRYSGNIGQLDLILALQWIRQHASEFGGDPANVTLVGESGGGAKISTLMAMPAAAGLFHKAVAISGQQVTAAGSRAATQRAELFLKQLKLSAQNTEELLKLPIDVLLNAAQVNDPSRIEDRPLEFLPVLDSVSLMRHPFYPDAPAQSSQIPMIIGNARWETRAFSKRDSGDFSLEWSQLPDKILHSQYVDADPEVVIATYRKIYPDFSPSDVFFAATTAGRSWRGAVMQAEARARQGAPAYVYQFDWTSQVEGGRFGGGHGSDLPLVFDNLMSSKRPAESLPGAQNVADQLSGMLLAMAKTGKPDHPGIPSWKPYTLENRETLVINETSALVNDPRGDERRFYAQFPFVQRGTF